MSATLSFSKISCAGRPYDIGAMFGELVKQNPELRNINIEENGTDAARLKSELSLQEEFCPNVVEEVNGASDALRLPLGRFTILSDKSLPVGACSQMAALPSVTGQQQIRGYNSTVPDTRVDLSGKCNRRKVYTIENKTLAKCTDSAFMFEEPSVKNILEYVNLLTTFYTAK